MPQFNYGCKVDIAAYASLFFIAFAAATIFPLQSELAVVGLLFAERQPWPVIVAIASAGNILGSILNWGLGRSLLRFQDRRWFPASRERLIQAESWYRRYGRGTLLLSWVPIIGDPLTLAAGLLREPLWSFTVLVGIAKTGRYLVVTALTLNLIS